MKTIRHTIDSAKVAEFATRYEGWHTFAKDKRTERAVKRAELLGCVELSKISRQFKSARS